MSYKYWLLFGSLGLGATQTVGCSSEFRTCETTRTCPRGGAGGTGGTAGTEHGGAGGAAVGGKGGSAGSHVEDGEAGAAGSHESDGGAAGSSETGGSAGMAGDSGVEMELEIAQPSLATGKTYVPFTGKITASGAAQYSWSVTSGALPAGLALQGAQSATVTIAGTPTQAGQFPITLSVSDGTETKSVDVALGITHPALFLSDRDTAGVNELFVAEIGAGTAATPVKLSASLASGGGVSSYSWSPDGSKVLYLATQSSGGVAELWVASLASAGTAQRVSVIGTTVSTLAWLGSGNVAAYSTTVGDTYLADVSGSAPSPSKLAIRGKGGAASLHPAPNGRSVVVITPIPASDANDSDLVTWASDAPATVPLLRAFPGNGPRFSYDGRFVMTGVGSGAAWEDLSLPAPTAQSGGQRHGALFAWSPNAEIFLAETGAEGYEISRYDLSGANPAVTVLVSSSLACDTIQIRPWSPDGKNGVYTCGNDVRGIGNVATAKVGSDFSLLPSGVFASIYGGDDAWSPNSQWVAVRASGSLNLIRWAAPGVAHRPHANILGSGVTTWAFAQNSQSVAIVGTIAPQNNPGLYLSKLPVSDAPPTAALVSAPANAVVQDDIKWLPGSRVIAYRATVSGATQLFAIPVAADGTAGSPVSISGVSGSGVTSYQLAPTR